MQGELLNVRQNVFKFSLFGQKKAWKDALHNKSVYAISISCSIKANNKVNLACSYDKRAHFTAQSFANSTYFGKSHDSCDKTEFAR